MARWMPQKTDVMAALAEEILHNYGRGRAIVAVDGASDFDTATFADDLAAAIRAVGHHVAQAEMNGFSRPRAERFARDSPQAHYDDAFDYSTFRRVLVEPFRTGLGASFVTRAFDLARDAAVQTKWITAPKDSILIVSGRFLHRPELAGLWNYSIWIDQSVDPDAETTPTTQTAAEGSGGGAQRLYHADADPRRRATAIIDYSDPEHPRRIFADSC